MTTENIENTENDIIPGKKIYKDKAITAGTYIGGPLVAGYFMAENFKAFNEPDKAKKAWIYSILFTIALYSSMFLIPGIDKVPNYLIPLTYTGIVYLLINFYQIKSINSHISAGKQVYSWGRTIVLSIIGLVVTVLPVIIIALLYDSATSADLVSKKYGALNHEISYSSDNITTSEVDHIADALTKTTFFDDAQTKYVYVKKVATTYEIRLSIDPNSLNQPEVTQLFKELRADLQTYFPNNKIVIVYIKDSIDEIIGRVE